ncbi:MAG: ribosome recycling factor [Alphaproteobacteria bacterium]|jgi:ribosome recycling factor|nr:ribosome recycling factor [Rhodospirillaceae bacterium]MBT6205372.1 ribosome recycling factor [Rhodospirillaceae bacterium]MBT6512173.1 ribosome recycling factor [Rhodospirillaceae bacterium]MBT7614085.1 ribosome recycling factor [Rhodospirillaceae bacterium]MDG2480892.1 ribosome recycling factor [Alphaproteobacteria bacterium]
MTDAIMKDLKRRMEGALEVLKKEFAGLRTGRASVSLLDPIMVEAYGSELPLNQVGSVSAPEPRLLTVQVWDKGQVRAVEKAIRDAGLGLNPQTDGQAVRVPIPQLDEERRTDLTRIAGKYAEQGKVAIRNVRRDGMDTLKRMEKDSEISQDEQHRSSDEIQTLTDAEVAKVDELLEAKQAEIMQV